MTPDINALLRECALALSHDGTECGVPCKKCRALDSIDNFLAAGMVAVPQNPTNKMAIAGRDARNAAIWANAIPAQSDQAVLDKISYKAMIAAAEGE